MAVYGGGDGDLFTQEKIALSEGVSVITATPGRLITHLKMGYVNMESLHFLVLDENTGIVESHLEFSKIQLVRIVAIPLIENCQEIRIQLMHGHHLCRICHDLLLLHDFLRTTQQSVRGARLSRESTVRKKTKNVRMFRELVRIQFLLSLQH